jgi:hypothetical protein
MSDTNGAATTGRTMQAIVQDIYGSATSYASRGSPDPRSPTPTCCYEYTRLASTGARGV